VKGFKETLNLASYYVEHDEYRYISIWYDLTWS